MIVLGLTGPTGSGKSTASRMLTDWDGIVVVDCDEVSRRVVGRGKTCLLDLAVEFSSAIINSDGTLNRRKLANIVFGDKAKLRRLNEIVFPYIMEELREEIASARKAGAMLTVLDAPTLFESKADALCDKVAVVTASPQLRRFRIMTRDQLSPKEVEDRMNSQHDEEFYTSRADFVIRNDEDTAALRLAVLELLNKLEL